MGDGGSGGDPEGNAQNTQTLLGKLLRLDVDGGQPYAIPASNPYAQGQGGLPEIVTLGLRNPWKFDFDLANGDLYIADVGQNAWEEVSYLPAGEIAGANLGWDYREGPAPYEGQPPADVSLVDPVAWYDRSGGCSISGGEVYRGAQFPEFSGVYLYADYCSGLIWGLLRLPSGEFQNAQLFQVSGRLVDFAQDPAGAFYLLDQSGAIFQLVRR
jgi:glucose/arabinose dehydrogenase